MVLIQLELGSVTLQRRHFRKQGKKITRRLERRVDGLCTVSFFEKSWPVEKSGYYKFDTSFDFDRLIIMRLMMPTGNADATLVVMEVDCDDFAGSF